MESPMPDAAGPDIAGAVTVESINYTQQALKHGHLWHQLVQSNQYGSPITLSAAQVPVVFNLPTEVMNFANTVLQFTVNLPAPAAGNYIWTYEDVISEIAHIQLYGSNNQFIVDLDNQANYSKIVLKSEVGQKEFLTGDVMNKLYPSNSLNNVVPALRVNSTSFAAQPSNKNYSEPAYFKVGQIATGVTYQVQIPLSKFKNTLLAMDKNFYFGQIMYIKVYFNQLNKIAYMSTSNASPNALLALDYASATIPPTITNLQLMLACEQNTAERNACVAKFTAGHRMFIPYVQSFKNPNSNGTQTIAIQIDTNMGRSLQKIYHVPFNNAESNATAYDCSNLPVDANTNQKCSAYWTNLNSVREQNITVQPTAAGFFTDYLLQKKSLDGSICENRDVFQYNWFHKSDYTSFSNEYVQEGRTDLISGIPMQMVPLTWSFYGQSMTPATYQHYTWGIFTKQLTISPGNILVD